MEIYIKKEFNNYFENLYYVIKSLNKVIYINFKS